MHIFSTPPLLDDGQQTDYSGQLEILNDKDFVEEAEKQIREAGYSRRHCIYDQKAGLCHTEAVRREKTWLYQRAYNEACRNVGMDVHPSDLDKARAPVAIAA